MNERKPPSIERQNWKSFSPGRPPVEPPPPPCTKCNSRMILTRIEPAEPGYDLRTFQCSACASQDQYMVKYQTSEPWVLVI
jgi:hypothetical protein